MEPGLETWSSSPLKTTLSIRLQSTRHLPYLYRNIFSSNVVDALKNQNIELVDEIEEFDLQNKVISLCRNQYIFRKEWQYYYMKL